MEIQFRPDERDLKVAQKYLCQELTRRSLWRFVPTVAGTVFGLFGMLGVISIFEFYREYRVLGLHGLTWGLGAIVFGTATLIVGLRVYTRVVMRQGFDPDGLYRSTQTVKPGDTHLIISSLNSQYQYAYGDILKVEEDSGFVYVFIDRGVALYIPYRAFGSDDARAAFVHELKQRIAR